MEIQTARIPVRSRRQAMDWSLVLASQGIEAVIEPPANDLGWGLVLRTQDHERALDALEKYCAENRGWSWTRQRVAAGILFDWTSVMWIFFLAFCYWLQIERPAFEKAGILDSQAVSAGQWWRIFTAVTLHADIKHLAMNCSTGLLLLGLAMGCYGTGTGLLAAFLAGAGGNVIALLIYGKHLGLGASGMVLGALGLLAVQWFVVARNDPRAGKFVLAGLAGSVLLFVLFGVSPETDVVAHAGGFATGVLLGGALAFVPEKLRRNSAVNLLSGLTLGALIVVCWVSALRAEQFASSPLTK